MMHHASFGKTISTNGAKHAALTVIRDGGTLLFPTDYATAVENVN
jgi:hypothetical protein